MKLTQRELVDELNAWIDAGRLAIFYGRDQILEDATLACPNGQCVQITSESTSRVHCEGMTGVEIWTTDHEKAMTVEELAKSVDSVSPKSHFAQHFIGAKPVMSIEREVGGPWVEYKQTEAPENAIAYKYADPTEGARWITAEDDLAEIEAADPSLIVRIVDEVK